MTMYLGRSTAGRTDVSGDPGASHSHSWEEGREETDRGTPGGQTGRHGKWDHRDTCRPTDSQPKRPEVKPTVIRKTVIQKDR